MICVGVGAGIRRPDAYTKLLVRMNGDGTAFRSLTGQTISQYGGATQDVSGSRYVGSAGVFDGNGDWLSYSADATINFSSGSWTIECEYYPQSETQYGGIFFTNSDGFSKNSVMVRYNDTGKIWVAVGDGSTYKGASTANNPGVGQWAHIAAVINRTTNMLELFINGVSVATTSISGFSIIDTGSVGTYIGKYAFSPTDYPINGKVSEFRVSNIVRYSSDFTRPTRRK